MLGSRRTASGRVDWDRDHYVVTITGRRVGSDDVATIEMSGRTWRALAPVRLAVEDELRRRDLPLPSDIPPLNDARSARVIPRARVAARNGLKWVTLTACRAGGARTVTIEMPWDEWANLAPVYWAINDQMEPPGEEPATRNAPDVQKKPLVSDLLSRTFWLAVSIFVPAASLAILLSLDELGSPLILAVLAVVVLNASIAVTDFAAQMRAEEKTSDKNHGRIPT